MSSVSRNRSHESLWQTLPRIRAVNLPCSIQHHHKVHSLVIPHNRDPTKTILLHTNQLYTPKIYIKNITTAKDYFDILYFPLASQSHLNSLILQYVTNLLDQYHDGPSLLTFNGQPPLRSVNFFPYLNSSNFGNHQKIYIYLQYNNPVQILFEICLM